jgi:hypothetical protein
MSDSRVEVHIHRRGGCLYGLGVIILACLALGAVVTFFAWPLYISAWPVWARAITEVAWVLLLVAGLIVYTAVSARPRGRHHHARPGVKAAPGPRDYVLPADDGYRVI